LKGVSGDLKKSAYGLNISDQCICEIWAVLHG